MRISRECIRGLSFSRLARHGVIVMASLLAFAGQTRGASAPAPVKSSEVLVYSEATESSLLLETLRESDALSPMAEMTGGGGEKWFMVKTPSGNIGWIKAGDYTQARKVNDHFRSLPKDVGTIGPATAVSESSGKATLSGAVTIPIRMYGNMVVVPVTFTNGNSTMTGNLAVDTGASQTMLSKRIATGLRLFAHDSQPRYGIGGSIRVDVSEVDSIKVGAAEAKNMRVSIHDFSPDPRFEGLLGFDFLGRFQMSVDAAKQVMILAPHQK
jgi:hypothetical protein